MPILPVVGSLLQRLVEHLHLADRAQAGELLGAVQNGQARRVVATIFEPPQALHEDGDDIAFGDGSDDSAHDCVLPRLLFARPGGPMAGVVRKCA